MNGNEITGAWRDEMHQITRPEGLTEEVLAEVRRVSEAPDEGPVAAHDAAIPHPVPYDTMILRVDIELGPERIRATETIDGYGPDLGTWDRVERFREAMNKLARELWTAAEDAGWGSK
jgi:hypothetical protein